MVAELFDHQKIYRFLFDDFFQLVVVTMNL